MPTFEQMQNIAQNGGQSPQYSSNLQASSYGAQGFLYNRPIPVSPNQYAAPQPQMPITQAVKAAEPVQTQPLQDAANINIVAPTPPAPAMMQGPIQAGLGLPPTSEYANKFRYNPWWRPI